MGPLGEIAAADAAAGAGFDTVASPAAGGLETVAAPAAGGFDTVVAPAAAGFDTVVEQQPQYHPSRIRLMEVSRDPPPSYSSVEDFVD